MGAMARHGLLLALLCSLLCASARAQMSADLMETTPVDWGSTRTLVMLVIQAVMLPCYVASGVLLFRRRRLWPIAGRGASMLLLINASSLWGSALNALVHVVYPRGMPCAMLVIITQAFLPFAAVMMVRGYLLVFRLEIANYLAELAWRKNKTQRLLQRQADDNELCGGGGGDAKGHTSGSGGFSVGVGGNSGLFPSPWLLPSLEPSTLPGHFCITNRRFAGARWIVGALCLAGAGMILSFILTGVFDWDVKLTNDWRESHGLPRDSPSNQYTHGAFLKGHRCFVYSIKFGTFDLAMLLAFPFVIFMAWRLRVNARLMEQRTQEQAEFDTVMRATASGADRADVGVDLATPLSDRGTGVPIPPQGATVTELDELAAVKREIGLCLFFGSLAIGAAMLMVDVAYEWINLVMTLAFAVLWALTAVPALVASYRIARKHREMMRRARRDTKSCLGVGKLVALIPHHRPLYRLAHVIADPHAYPVLLKFLQKEFSSENALFYIGARRFTRECRAAERVLPGWSSSLDEDDSSNTHTAEGSPMHSMVSAGAGHLAGPSAVLDPLPPTHAHAESGSSAVLDLSAFTDRPSSATPGLSTPDGGPPQPNSLHYVIMEPLLESESLSKRDSGEMSDRARSAGPPLSRVASFRPTATRPSSTGRHARTFMMSIRVEQAGGNNGGGGGILGSGTDDLASTRSSLALPSALSSPAASPLLQGVSATPTTPLTGMPLLGLPLGTCSSAQGSPGASRATSARGVGFELSSTSTVLTSPPGTDRSVSGSPLVAYCGARSSSPPLNPQLQRVQGIHASKGPAIVAMQRSNSARRVSSPYTVRSPGLNQARAELAWGPVPSPAVAAGSSGTPSSPHRSPSQTPRPLRLLSKPSPMQRQQTRAARKLLVAQAAPKPIKPQPAPMTFRQMHELAFKLRARCLQLYDEYLRPNSVYQINIANDLAKMLRAQVAQLEQWQPTPLTAEGEPDFERAAMESSPPLPPPFPLSSLYQQTALSVFTLMETDSFRRFLLTADFQSLLQRADDQEMERLEKQSCMAADTQAVLASADAALDAHAASHHSLPLISHLVSVDGDSARLVGMSHQAHAPLNNPTTHSRAHHA